MNTDLCKEVADEIRRQARVGSFDMRVWFKVNIPVGSAPDDEDAGENITEASDMQDQFDRIVEGRWGHTPPATFKECNSAGCAAGTVLWVQMRKGLRYEHGTIENIAERELDLPGGAAEAIFRMTDLDGSEIAEVFDGLADETIVWRTYEYDASDNVASEPGLYFLTPDDTYEAVTDTDLALLANARAQVDVTRKRLIADKRRHRITVEINRAEEHLADLRSQLRSEMDDEVDSEPF